MAEVARLFGLSTQRIQQIVSGTRLPPARRDRVLQVMRENMGRPNYQPKPRPPSGLAIEAARLHFTGLTYSQVARKLGVSRCAVAGAVFRAKRRADRA